VRYANLAAGICAKSSFGLPLMSDLNTDLIYTEHKSYANPDKMIMDLIILYKWSIENTYSINISRT
jgi:hypothetical protein